MVFLSLFPSGALGHAERGRQCGGCRGAGWSRVSPSSSPRAAEWGAQVQDERGELLGLFLRLCVQFCFQRCVVFPDCD